MFAIYTLRDLVVSYQRISFNPSPTYGVYMSTAKQAVLAQAVLRASRHRDEVVTGCVKSSVNNLKLVRENTG